jgi:hypothetical protein
MKRFLILSAAFLLIPELNACTLFWACRNDQIFCAKNMDWSNPDCQMLFIPASDGKYGRVYFGIASNFGFTNTSGMNELGLWYGGASLPERTDIKNSYNKPGWNYELIEKVMEECETVEEAIEVFTTFWEPHWNGHLLIADIYGNNAVIEYGDNDIIIIRSDKDCQVITNFYLCDTINSRWYNCYRHNVAETMLEEAPEISFDLFRDIAETTHAKGKFQTVLTTIHDLKSCDIQLFNMHNFNEYLTINLPQELEKGEHYLKCSDFFSLIRVLNPKNGSKLAGNSVKLEWTGESDNYIIQYSRFSDFREMHELAYSYPGTGIQKSGFDTGFFFAIITCLFLLKWKRIKIIVILCLFNATLSSCEKTDIEPQYSKKIHEQVITGLDLATTYYWRIKNMADEYPTYSITSCFDIL